MSLHKALFLCTLDRNPQAESQPFGDLSRASQKCPLPQVTRREWVTTKNFDLDFHLTGEPLGNKIQLPKFLTVAIPSITDSPIEHHP
jgi:hypothetical protein